MFLPIILFLASAELNDPHGCASDRPARVARSAAHEKTMDRRNDDAGWAHQHCKIIDARQSVPYVYRDTRTGVLFVRDRWVGGRYLQCNAPMPRTLTKDLWLARDARKWFTPSPTDLLQSEYERNEICSALDEEALDGESLCTDWWCGYDD